MEKNNSKASGRANSKANSRKNGRTISRGNGRTMRIRHLHVFHILGHLLLALAGVMLICAVWSLATNEPDVEYIVLSAIITGVTGLLLRFLTAFKNEITLLESFMLVTLAWFFAGIFGSLPFFFSGVLPAYADAFFEAVSGFTTTGATLIEDIEASPKGILLWRSFTQWLGGMGIIVMFVALLPRLGYRGMNLFRAEMPGVFTDRVVPRVAVMARQLWLVYIFLTGLLLILLLLCRVPFYHALNHALTTMPTGGFSTFNDSVLGMGNPLVEVIITVFMLLAGINFALYYFLLRGDGRVIIGDTELRFYLIMVAVATVLVCINISPQYDLADTLRLGAFQVAAVITTTGFATADFDAWPDLSRALLFIFMFVGGSGGSTAGSMKQIRVMLLLKYAYREISRMLHPTVVSAVKIGRRPVQEELLRSVMAFFFIYMFSFTMAFLALSAMNLDMVTAMSAVAATIGNIGPGLGLVGPENTFQAIPMGGRLLLCVIMIIGRLELFTVLVFLLFGWRRN